MSSEAQRYDEIASAWAIFAQQVREVPVDIRQAVNGVLAAGLFLRQLLGEHQGSPWHEIASCVRPRRVSTEAKSRSAANHASRTLGWTESASDRPCASAV